MSYGWTTQDKWQWVQSLEKLPVKTPLVVDEMSRPLKRMFNGRRQNQGWCERLGSKLVAMARRVGRFEGVDYERRKPWLPECVEGAALLYVEGSVSSPEGCALH